MHTLTLPQLRRLRLRAQGIHPYPAGAAASVAALAGRVVAFQGQELPSATLAVRARSADLLAEDVRRAREDDRSVVLTWAMRGTLHLLPAADFPWLMAVLGPLFIGHGERRYRQLGLDLATRRKAADLMREVLTARGPLIRRELAEALAAQGIPVEGQAIAHLVSYAALAGVICFGPQRGSQRGAQHGPQHSDLTYVVLEDWLPGQSTPPSPELGAFEARLARRYLAGYGPATPQALARWSGLTIPQARAGFEALADDLLAVDAAGSPAWMLREQAAWLDELTDERIVRLLPAYDGYTLGYQGRDWIIAEAHARRLHPGGGLIRPAVLVDGAVVGVWRRKPGKRGSTIEVEPFAPLPGDVLPLLEAEAQDMGRFLGEAVTLAVGDS